MHWNGLSSTHVGFEDMPNPMAQVLSLCNKQFQKKSQFQAKISHFVDFDWEQCIEIAWVVHIYGLRHATSNTIDFKSLPQWFLKNHNFRQKISHFVDFDWEKCIVLSGTYLRVWGMLNPMALVVGPFNKRFMKNHNFRRHIAANGVQIHENGMGHMQQSSLGHILPLHHVSKLNILTFP